MVAERTDQCAGRCMRAITYLGTGVHSCGGIYQYQRVASGSIRHTNMGASLPSLLRSRSMIVQKTLHQLDFTGHVGDRTLCRAREHRDCLRLCASGCFIVRIAPRATATGSESSGRCRLVWRRIRIDELSENSCV